MGTQHERDGTESNQQVHVRTLGVSDTLRWSWDVLTDRVELVGLTLVVTLFSAVQMLGISRPAPRAPPEFASWVWPAYVVFGLALAVVWAVAYQTASNGVENRSQPLGDQIKAGVGHVPALVGTAILMFVISVIGLVFLVIPGIYLFHRLLLAYPAVVIDGEGPVGAIKASWSAAGGNVLKIFSLMLLYYVLVGVSSFVAGQFGQYTLASGVVSAVLAAVLIPLFGLALGHLYLETSRNT